MHTRTKGRDKDFAIGGWNDFHTRQCIRQMRIGRGVSGGGEGGREGGGGGGGGGGEREED